MDKEDTTQNIEHRQAVGSEHQPFFLDMFLTLRLIFLVGNDLLVHNERILKECISFWKLPC